MLGPEKQLSVFHRNGAKKNNLVRGSSIGGNALSMRELRGEWPDWFELTDRL